MLLSPWMPEAICIRQLLLELLESPAELINVIRLKLNVAIPEESLYSVAIQSNFESNLRQQGRLSYTVWSHHNGRLARFD
jgi:hypothetical protein